MEDKSLFIPQLDQSQSYGKKLTDLIYKLAFSTREELRDELKNPIPLGAIPFVLRSVGINAGSIKLIPNNIPHMIGFGQEKTSVHYRNMHDLDIEEMLAIPYMVSNPDMVFRSNTQPNSSIILCKEVENRGKPIVLAMKISIQDSLNSTGIIVSGYEKDNSPESFFSNLYKYGYCIYDSLESKYFESIKIGAGARDRKVGPIPTYAVACTAPQDKALSTGGISPSINYRVLTKSDIVKKYKENSNEVIAILNEDRETAIKAERNLSELGYHTIIPNSLSHQEITTLIKSATAIACDRDMIQRFAVLQSNTTNIRKVGQAIDFMPEPIFKHQMKNLQATIEEQRTQERRISR